MTPSERFQKLLHHAKESSRQIGAMFTSPHDDWMPALIVAGPSNQPKVVGFDPAFLSDGRSKNLMAMLMGREAGQTGIDTAVMIASAWQKEISTPSPTELARLNRTGLKDEPGRKEMLFISAVSLNLDEFWFAEITRDGRRPPTLGEWQTSSVSENRFAGPIRSAMIAQRQ